MIPDQEAEGSGPLLSTILHISLRFLSRLGRAEALTGFEGLVRGILVFFFPSSCCHLCLAFCLGSPHLTG